MYDHSATVSGSRLFKSTDYSIYFASNLNVIQSRLLVRACLCKGVLIVTDP